MATAAPMPAPRPPRIHELPEWSDLVPIPQVETEEPMVAIAYAPEYREAMDLFRALVNAQELSERGLDLTIRILKINPAHYTVWAYRAKTVTELHRRDPDKRLLEAELALMDTLVKAHLKSYQIWQHRRNIVTELGDPTREMPFVDKALAIDSKNYHTWAYRQWALCHFDWKEMWEAELPFVDHLLRLDVRNNSAWNHRFFIRFESPFASDVSATAAQEIEWTKAKILEVPNNVSAWNYLRGVLKKSDRPLSSLSSFAAPLTQSSPSPASALIEDPASDKLLQLNPKADLPVVMAIEFLADAMFEEEKRLGRQGRARESISLYKVLEEERDLVRRKYWGYRRRCVEKWCEEAGL